MGVVRKTKSVKILLDIFKNNDEAISAVKLVSRLEKEMNKTTIYRILERLENDGVVHSFIGLDGIKWYAKCKGCSSTKHIDSHPHFQCQLCGKVECLSVNVLVPELPDRKITSTQILLTGLCGTCSD